MHEASHRDAFFVWAHSDTAPEVSRHFVWSSAFTRFGAGFGSNRLKAELQTASPQLTVQIAKSLYSGFTDSVGGNSIPAATVAFVPGSIKMNDPVSRFVA